MSKLIIVDGNSLLFRAFYALYTINPTNIMRTSDGVPTNAIYIFSNMLASLLSSLKDGDGIFVAFDAGKHTFRHKEFADYKANRPKCPEELLEQMPIAREFLDELNILHYENENLEADDICGIMANNAAKEGYDVEIYTSDKDYLQLINDKITIELIRKGLKDIHRMDRDAFINEWGIEPIQICDYKGLRGDDSDNLKGIPGIGDKTAKLLISKFGDLENIIKNADLKTKVGKNLVEYQDQGRLCKHLAIIATNESIPLTPSDTIYKGYDFSKISNFALKYQFRTLLNKLPKQYKLEKKVANVIDFTENLDYSDILNAKEIGLAIDIEKLNYHDARLFGIAITTQNNTYYIHYESLIKDLKILDLLNNKDVKKFTFDYKKILCVFARYNIKVDGLYFDLLLANYLLDSNSKADIESLLISKGIDISYALKNENLLFDDSHIKLTAITSYYSLNLFDDYKENLKAKNQLDLLYDIEMPLTIVLAKMEIEGFPLDKDTLLTFKDDFQKKVDSLAEDIYTLAGETFNINSPKQVSTILYEKLGLPANKKGSTSVDHLQTIHNLHPIIGKILEYRKYAKLISTYIDGLVPFIKADGKVHCTFNQALTTTGRLSCSEPNLQNISTRDEEGKQIRKAFFYKEDNIEILSLDYSQIELRILAHLSNSASLIKVFNENQDIHSATAKRIFNLDREPTSLERRKAKAVNFGIIYGISFYGLSEQLEIPINESKEIIMNFNKAFPEINAFRESLIETAVTNGYAITMFNRRRYLPEINSSQYQAREFARRAATNAPIQGSAADLIKIAMIKVDEALTKGNYKSKLISQIHDELILKVYDDEKDKVYNLVKDIMENCVQLKVKLKVDGGYAKNRFLAK